MGVLVIIFCMHMHRTLSTSEPVQTVGDRCDRSTHALLSLFGTIRRQQQQQEKNKKKSYDQPRQHIKKQRRYFAYKGLPSQSYSFSSSHVWIWELNYKESWVLKNWSFWTVVLEKTLESPLDSKEIQPVHPKGSWNSNTLATWCKNWLLGKDPDAGKDWGQEEKGTTEDEMVGWHHRLNGHEFE